MRSSQAPRDRMVPHLESWAGEKSRSKSCSPLKAADREHASDKTNREKYGMGENVGSHHPKCIPWDTHVLRNKSSMRNTSVIKYIWGGMGK